jgi:hypothetical protein
MKRLAAVLATAGALATAGPAAACLIGEPAAGSCGLGRAAAKAAVESPTSPGATEAARMKPGGPDRDCIGAPPR